MGFHSLLKKLGFETKVKSGIMPSGVLVTRNGRTYSPVDENEIPKWVWNKFKKMEHGGATSGSFKGKKYRYIIQYIGGGMYGCWKRRRKKKI